MQPHTLICERTEKQFKRPTRQNNHNKMTNKSAPTNDNSVHNVFQLLQLNQRKHRHHGRLETN